MPDILVGEKGWTDATVGRAYDPRSGNVMGQVVTVIPVKGLREAKTRLAGVLSPLQRRNLVLGCLRLELTVLSSIAEIDEVIVVTPDREVGRTAEAMGAHVLVEPSARGHNAALHFALPQLGRGNGRDVMIVPADLPLLSVSCVQSLLKLRPRGEPAITIAPDRLRSGTNALITTLTATVTFNFGADSFHRHVQAAQAQGLIVRVLEQTGLGLDIDTPADLAILRLIDPNLSSLLIGEAEVAG